MRFIYTRTFLVFFICLCILVILVFLNTRGALDQMKRFFLRLPGPTVNFARGLNENSKSFFKTLYELKGLSNENIELKHKISQLEQQLAQAEAGSRDNQILRAELGFLKSSKLDLLPCEVLSGDSLNLTDTINLNCGEEQGLIEGQAIMAEGHIIGKIIYVSRTISTALLATSSKFLMDARLSKSGKVGAVKGSFGSGILLDQLPQSTEVEKGSLVVTAGINSLVPKDLLIGEVGDIISSSSDLFKKASLITPVDFNNLQFIFVVK